MTRARRERDALEIIAFAGRAVKAAGRRAGAGDEFELAELVALRGVLEQAIAGAVADQRSDGRSWAHIGDALGVTRQNAQQRYGRAS